MTLTYHLLIKFPIEYGVGEVRGDQVARRECYIAMLCIEEQRTVAEPVEGLEELLFNDARPERTTKIGTLASLSSTHDIHKGKPGCVRLES